MTLNLSDRIAERIRMDIRAGRFKEDGRLPTERELALRFSVARNTVRRAIDALEDEALVERQVGRGTFIVSAPSVQLKGAPEIEAMVQAKTVGLSPAEVSPNHLIEARLLIEPSVAAQAAINATDADIAVLTAAQAASESCNDQETFERHDAEIHQHLFAMVRNPLMAHFETVLTDMRTNADWRSAKQNSYSRELKAKYIKQHAAVIQAITNRSSSAARQAMMAHLEDVRRALLDH